MRSRGGATTRGRVTLPRLVTKVASRSRGRAAPARFCSSLHQSRKSGIKHTRATTARKSHVRGVLVTHHTTGSRRSRRAMHNSSRKTTWLARDPTITYGSDDQPGNMELPSRFVHFLIRTLISVVPPMIVVVAVYCERCLRADSVTAAWSARAARRVLGALRARGARSSVSSLQV